MSVSTHDIAPVPATTPTEQRTAEVAIEMLREWIDELPAAATSGRRRARSRS